MVRRPRSIDVRGLLDVLRLAEEVRATNEPCVLILEGEEIAVVLPLKASKQHRSASQPKLDAAFAAFRSAAGGWRDVDSDRLLADIYADRERADRPPVEL